MQVHKETVTKVPYAIPGRDSTEITIYGMEGMPEGATRGRTNEDQEEPASKQSRLSGYGGSVMSGMGASGMYGGYPPMPPMPPQYGSGGQPPMPYGTPPMPPYRGHYPQQSAHAFGAFGGPGTTPTPIGPSRPDNSYGAESSSQKVQLPNAEENSYGYGSHVDNSRERAYVKEELRESYDSPRDEYLSKGAPVPYPANSSKLTAKTRIIHPDDHSISLEERRAMMVMNANTSSYR